MLSFQVHPGKYNHMAHEEMCYWEVRVFSTLFNMYRGYRRLKRWTRHKEDTDFHAIVMPQSFYEICPGKKDKLSPLLGHVLFFKGHLTGNIVAHEAVHMGMEYLRRQRFTTKFSGHVDDKEERLAYTVGICTQTITNALYDGKIW